jgi:hypothetical protein
MTSIQSNYPFNRSNNGSNNTGSSSGGSNGTNNGIKQQISLRGRTESPATSNQRKFNTTGQVATMISRLPASVSGSNGIQRQSTNGKLSSTATTTTGGTPPSSAEYFNNYLNKASLNPTIRRSSFKSLINDDSNPQQTLNKLKIHAQQQQQQQQSVSKQQSEQLIEQQRTNNIKSSKYTNLYSNLNQSTSQPSNNKDNINESFYLLNLNNNKVHSSSSSTSNPTSAKNNILNNNDRSINQTSTRQAGVKLSIGTTQIRNGSANTNENDYRFQQTQSQPVYIQESTPFYSPTATNITSSSSSSSYKSSNQMPSSSSLSSSSSTKYNNSTSIYSNNNNNNSIYDNSHELESKGMVGLKNLGNTCFMNSILQCLSNTKCLLEYCITNSYTDDINTTLSVMKGSLFNSYASLIKTMWKSETIVSPQDFKSQIARFASRFVGYAQQDAEEFLYYLLKGLHEDVNLVRKKPSPFRFDEKAWDRMKYNQ